MEIKFFTDNGVLDLSYQNISFQESNSKLSDKRLTKFTFPFEVFINEEFIHSFGDYVSHESRNLIKEIKGNLLFEGKLHEAILDIVSIEGNYLTGQIDFGFDEIPNYDKKLSELPLEKFDVPDIYTYALEICKQKYPDTNFNFPRIHTTKYSPSEKMWDAFEGYYNHTTLKSGKLEMARNVYPTEHNNWTIDNVNIIHPCPHILYLLKVGFADAGYTLAGDILTDENLGQRWVFSGTQYFINKKIISEEYIVSSTEAYKSDNYYNSSATASNIDTQGTIYYFRKTINFNRIDKYRLDFSFPVSKIESQPFIFEMDVEIKLRGKVIRREERKMRAHVFNIVGEGLKFSFDIDTETTNDELEVHIICKGNYRLNMYGDVMVLKARSMTGFIDEKRATVQDTRIVENPNTIDLTRAVPNMTFSEFVGIIQNWFNYDLKIIDRKVYMNKIGAEEPPEPKDFRVYEISNPKRTLLIEKSYLLKFADLDDGYKLDTMYYDKNGEKLNGFPNKDTSTIEINGYAMPIAKAKEFHTPTAQVKKDSDTTLALVYYDGLREGINNAINPTGCHFPELFYNNWEKWLKQRVISREYQWKFLANIQDISQFSMNDYLFCYQKLHLIKTMNKDKIAPNTYEVEITTETSI